MKLGVYNCGEGSSVWKELELRVVNSPSKLERELYNHDIHFSQWNESVAGHHWLDRYCSSPYWGLALCEAFQPEGKLYCYRDSSDEHFAAFYERKVEGGELILPTDGMWLLGSSIFGPQPEVFFQELLQYWAKFPKGGTLRQIMLTGLYPNHPLMRSNPWEVFGGWEIESSGRMIASLENGLDGFMSRRSKNFRSRLRRMVKAATSAGIEVEFMPCQADLSTCETLIERIFRLEKQSWKGQARRGIDSGGMRHFYELMIPDLASDGLLRGLFLTREGKDLAYLFGASFDDYFRGLQFSFIDEEKLGLGNVCQYHMISRLTEEGCVDYDLGQAMAYKRRWAETHIESRSFIFQLKT